MHKTKYVILLSYRIFILRASCCGIYDILNFDMQDGNTALIQACLCNHLDIARMLLENGASVHKADKVVLSIL